MSYVLQLRALAAPDLVDGGNTEAEFHADRFPVKPTAEGITDIPMRARFDVHETALCESNNLLACKLKDHVDVNDSLNSILSLNLLYSTHDAKTGG